MQTKIYTMYVYLMCCLFLYCCDSRHSHNEKINIYGKTLVKDNIGLPYDIEIVGDNIILIDTKPIKDENKVLLFRASDGLFINSFGRVGKGPCEFIHPGKISSVDKSGRLVSIFDAGLLRLSILNPLKPEPNKIKIVTTTEGIPYFPVWLSDSFFVSPGFRLKKRLGFYDANGKLLKEVGDFGKDLEKYPISAVQEAFQITIKSNPDKSKIVIAYKCLDKLEIYNNNGVLLKQVIGPKRINRSVNIKVSQDGKQRIVKGKNDPVAYSALATTDKYIFALFCGRTFDEYQKGLRSKEIHVFDWNGDFKGVFMLENENVSIAVDRDGQNLYAIQHSPEVAIVKYTLPKI